MIIAGNETGNLTINANCAGIRVIQSLNFVGPGAPAFGVTAPAALAGTILSQSGGTLTLADALAQITVANHASLTLAVFWTAGDVQCAAFDIAIDSVSVTSGVDTVSLAGGSHQPTNARYWAASGSAPTSIPKRL